MKQMELKRTVRVRETDRREDEPREEEEGV